MQNSAEPILQVQDLEVEFLTDHGWVTVVDGVSFEVHAGETLGLVGESGSGKTVTSLSVMRLIPSPPGRISGGRILFKGQDLAAMSESQLSDLRGNDIAMVFQESMTSLNPAFTIGDQIAEVVRRHRGCSRKQARARAIEVLELVQIPNPSERLNSYPHEFSGGMRQRAAIAMALACEPKLLIADEPTTALDVTVQAQVLDLLRSLRDKFGMAVLFVTHNLGVVADLCDRVTVMYAGRIAETATVDDLFASPRHPYTEGLMRSMPQLGERGQRLPSIPGTPPMPWMMPTGCRFHPRCPYAEAACESQHVSLVEVDPSHFSRCRRVHELKLQGAA